jgi:hypothetical protein
MLHLTKLKINNVLLIALIDLTLVASVIIVVLYLLSIKQQNGVKMEKYRRVIKPVKFAADWAYNKNIATSM